MKLMKMTALALAAALGNSFGGLLDVVPPLLKTRNRGKGRGRRPGQWALHLKKSRPTDKRHWHNLNDQVQRDALQAAEAKRERKADKLQLDTLHAIRCNRAHRDGEFRNHGTVAYADLPARLNPLYVNRGEVV